MSDDAPIDAAGYHERTKHRFDAYARGPDHIDWEAQPDPFRRYDGTPLTPLPLGADTITLPFSALFDPTPITARALDVNAVGILLEISLALSAWKQYGSSRWSLRCNPSSGNLHPTEAYLIGRGISGLVDGVHHYRADVHALEQRCRFDPTEGDTPALWLGLSSVHWREAWKYGERAYRYCQLDVGHALAALSYAAATLGWRVTLCDTLGDDRLAQLLGVDRHADFAGAEPEHPDLLLAIHRAAAAPADIAPVLAAAARGRWSGRANVLDPQPFYTWPVIEAVALACRKPELPPAASVVIDSVAPPLPAACEEAAAALFRRRRSAQAFDGITAMARNDFFRLLDHLLPRAGLAPWNGLPWVPRIHPLLFVHRVDDLPAGLYALPRRREALALLQQAMRREFAWESVDGAPAQLPLYRLVAARAERTAANLACRQDIAGDGAFSLALLAEFDDNVLATPWRYRELHWEAGAIGQVLYLEAEASGLRGTGIGCFFDDGVHELLGINDRKLQSLYHFTVGGALTDRRIVSLPPYEMRSDQSSGAKQRT